MSPFNLSLNTIENYVKYINKTKAKLIVTYPSLANFMALLMEEKKLHYYTSFLLWYRNLTFVLYLN